MRVPARPSTADVDQSALIAEHGRTLEKDLLMGPFIACAILHVHNRP
jgi:hypothetical protein